MWGPGFDQKRAGLQEGERTGGQFVRVSYKSFQRDKSDGFGKKKRKKCISLSWGGVGAGGGRVGQLNMCVETVHYFEGIIYFYI